MHNCAVWALLLEHHFALKCRGDEINQPCGAFGEQIRSEGMESFRYCFYGHWLRNGDFGAMRHRRNETEISHGRGSLANTLVPGESGNGRAAEKWQATNETSSP